MMKTELFVFTESFAALPMLADIESFTAEQPSTLLIAHFFVETKQRGKIFSLFTLLSLLDISSSEAKQ